MPAMTLAIAFMNLCAVILILWVPGLSVTSSLGALLFWGNTTSLGIMLFLSAKNWRGGND